MSSSPNLNNYLFFCKSQKAPNTANRLLWEREHNKQGESCQEKVLGRWLKLKQYMRPAGSTASMWETIILSLTSLFVNCGCFWNCQFKGGKKLPSSLHLSLAILLYSCSRYPYGWPAERQRGRGPLPGVSDSHKCVKEEKWSGSPASLLSVPQARVSP